MPSTEGTSVATRCASLVIWRPPGTRRSPTLGSVTEDRWWTARMITLIAYPLWNEFAKMRRADPSGIAGPDIARSGGLAPLSPKQLPIAGRHHVPPAADGAPHAI